MGACDYEAVSALVDGELTDEGIADRLDALADQVVDYAERFRR